MRADRIIFWHFQLSSACERRPIGGIGEVNEHQSMGHAPIHYSRVSELKSNTREIHSPKLILIELTLDRFYYIHLL